MKFLKGLLVTVLILAVLLAVGLGIGGHFLIVSALGDNGSVAKLGFTGYGDVFSAFGAVSSAPPQITDENKASDDNKQLLLNSLYANSMAISGNEAAAFVALYGGLIVFTPEVKLTGGMTAAAVQQGLTVYSQIDSTFAYDLEGVTINPTSDKAAELDFTMSITKDELFKLCEIAEKDRKTFDTFIKGDKIYITLVVNAEVSNGKIDLPETVEARVNSSKASQTEKIFAYIEKENDDVMLTTTRAVIMAINNWGRISFSESDDSLVLQGMGIL